MKTDLARRTVAEGLGTAILLATVVGSGIVGERLAGGNVAVALLANTIATGAALVALILTFGGISGAHFNPAVTAHPRIFACRKPAGVGMRRQKSFRAGVTMSVLKMEVGNSKTVSPQSNSPKMLSPEFGSAKRKENTI
jgi:long-subunit fatty acid transport protein